MNTYEDYLNHPAGDILTIEDALKIYGEVADCVKKCTADFKGEIWQEFLTCAAEYTAIRNKWEHMSMEERIAEDERRALKHDSFITKVNMLSRMAEQDGVDNSWRAELGDARKRIGDFACFVTYITGISNR